MSDASRAPVTYRRRGSGGWTAIDEHTGMVLGDIMRRSRFGGLKPDLDPEWAQHDWRVGNHPHDIYYRTRNDAAWALLRQASPAAVNAALDVVHFGCVYCDDWGPARSRLGLRRHLTEAHGADPVPRRQRGAA